MDEDIKGRLKSSSLWTRALFMVLFAFISVIARAVISLLAVVQFIIVMLTGHANEAMLQLGNNLSVYVADMVRFVTFNSEIKPYPFSPWPDEPIEANPWREDDEAEAEPEAPEVASVTVDAPDEPDAKPKGETDARRAV